MKARIKYFTRKETGDISAIILLDNVKILLDSIRWNDDMQYVRFNMLIEGVNTESCDECIYIAEDGVTINWFVMSFSTQGGYKHVDNEKLQTPIKEISHRNFKQVIQHIFNSKQFETILYIGISKKLEAIKNKKIKLLKEIRDIDKQIKQLAKINKKQIKKGKQNDQKSKIKS